MINKGNYFSTIESIGVNTLPPTLMKSHEFVLKATRNGESWTSYSTSEAIKNVIDLYFQKLHEFIAASKPGSNKSAAKAASSTKHKTKKAKQPKAKRESPEAKQVARITEEVKFIKRFVALHNKVKSPQAILSFIKSLQRAIVQKLIRKTSPFAREIERIQERLITVYQKMKGDEGMKISEDELSKLVVIAGGEKVYPSLNIIKRYIGLQGKPADKELVTRFTAQIAKALDSKIMSDDPYAEKVKKIYNTIRNSKNNKSFSISASELSGLAGIVKDCQCKQTHPRHISPRKKKSLDKKNISKTASGLSGVLTAQEMATRKLDLLNFTSFWLTLFGKPGKNFTMMFYGEPHNGKTIFLLKLAQYLAENFGNVLYVSSEEFASTTMTQKVNEFLTPLPTRLHFAENLTDPKLAGYDYIILDSVNDLKLKLNDYKEIRKKHPDKAFIFILQSTKSGDFRGGKDWEHLAEVVGEVHKGTVTMIKNRYGSKAILNFFKQFGLQWSDPVEEQQDYNEQIQSKPDIVNGNSMMTNDESHY